MLGEAGIPKYACSHRYMAPELLKNELSSCLDKADMFALGATLYELATGTELPKNGERYQQLRSGQLGLITHVNTKIVGMIKVGGGPGRAGGHAVGDLGIWGFGV